jgi:hypothetical protein
MSGSDLEDHQLVISIEQNRYREEGAAFAADARRAPEKNCRSLQAPEAGATQIARGYHGYQG